MQVNQWPVSVRPDGIKYAHANADYFCNAFRHWLIKAGYSIKNVESLIARYFAILEVVNQSSIDL